MWSAYVDESGSNSAKDPGTYILAAAIAEQSNLSEVTAAVEGLLLRGQRKLHWSDESEKRQRLIAQTVARLPLEHLVVVRTGALSDRSERRRRKCLEELFRRFDEVGVTEATFESRGTKDDQRDLSALQSFRSSKVITGSLRIYHRPGPREPLLWIPDAICGAVTAQRSGDRQFLTVIESHCTIYTI